MVSIDKIKVINDELVYEAEVMKFSTHSAHVIVPMEWIGKVADIRIKVKKEEKKKEKEKDKKEIE